MTPPPVPFGDPSRVQNENRDAVKKGVLFGCGGCGALVTCFIALFVFAMAGVLYFMRHSEVNELAVAKARQSPQIVAALGEPVEQGWWVSGNVSVSGSSGEADLTIPISGPKGSASMHIIATKDASGWKFTLFDVSLPDGSHVNLSGHPDVTRSQLRQQLLVHPVEATVAEHNDHVAALGA